LTAHVLVIDGAGYIGSHACKALAHEVISQARIMTNHDVLVTYGERRAGDAATLVCGAQRATQELGWVPQKSTLFEMVKDAWVWVKKPSLDFGCIV
jgi:UDP-glucose 4-epimerase